TKIFATEPEPASAIGHHRVIAVSVVERRRVVRVLAEIAAVTADADHHALDRLKADMALEVHAVGAGWILVTTAVDDGRLVVEHAAVAEQVYAPIGRAAKLGAIHDGALDEAVAVPVFHERNPCHAGRPDAQRREFRECALEIGLL